MGRAGLTGQVTPFFSGPSETYAITETDCAQQGVRVSLTPLGARRLLGFPLYAVRDRLIDPTELFGQSARRAMERLWEADAPERRLAIIEREMELALARPRDRSQTDPRLRRAAFFARLSGRIGIAALAEELLGRSRKHLRLIRSSESLGMRTPNTLFGSASWRFDLGPPWPRSGGRLGLGGTEDASAHYRIKRTIRDFEPPLPAAGAGGLYGAALPDEGGFVD